MDIQGKITYFLHLLVSVFRPPWDFISAHICQGYALLAVHKERILAMFFFVLEAVSVVLDLTGKNKVDFLLAAFLLSVIGFAITLYSFIKARTNPKIMAEMELMVVEIVFSLIQLIVTSIQFLKPKNNYNASAFPLAFAMIAVVFVFIKDRNITDSSTTDSLPLTNLLQPNIGSMTSTLNQIVDSSPTDLLPLTNFQQPIGSMTSTLNPIVSSTDQFNPGSSANQDKPESFTGKRPTHARNKSGSSTDQDKPGSSTNQNKPGSSTGKRPTHARNKSGSSTDQDKPGSSTNHDKPGSSTGKRPTHARNKLVVMKLEINGKDDKAKKEAQKKVAETVIDIPGDASFSMDPKDSKLTIIGDIVPEDVVNKLRKICHTELISVKTKEPKEEKKAEEVAQLQLVSPYQAYYPYQAYNPYDYQSYHPYHYQSYNPFQAYNPYQNKDDHFKVE